MSCFKGPDPALGEAVSTGPKLVGVNEDADEEEDDCRDFFSLKDGPEISSAVPSEDFRRTSFRSPSALLRDGEEKSEEDVLMYSLLEGSYTCGWELPSMRILRGGIRVSEGTELREADKEVTGLEIGWKLLLVTLAKLETAFADAVRETALADSADEMTGLFEACCC